MRNETHLARNKSRLAGNENRLAGTENCHTRNFSFLASALQVPPICSVEIQNTASLLSYFL